MWSLMRMVLLQGSSPATQRSSVVSAAAGWPAEQTTDAARLKRETQCHAVVSAPARDRAADNGGSGG